MIARSENIGDLAAALAKAQGQMTAAAKDSVNPHFKSKYADLAAVWDAIREPLSQNGLAVVQAPRLTDGNAQVLDSILLHASGQWMASTLEIKCKDALPQTQGSAITYARRYALMALVGIAPDDDDGNAAQASYKSNYASQNSKSTITKDTTTLRAVPAEGHIHFVPQVLAALSAESIDASGWSDETRSSLISLIEKKGVELSDTERLRKAVRYFADKMGEGT